MSQQSRNTLKTYFETGDRPTQSQFSDLIDSAAWYDEAGAVDELYDLLGYSAKGETIGVNVLNCGGALAMTDQQVRFTPVKIKEDGTITGVRWVQSQQGNYTGNNENRIGLYSFDAGLLTLVAATANDSELWKVAATAPGTKNFSSTYNAAAGIYWIGVIYCRSAQVTGPSLLGGVTSLAAAVMEAGFTTNYKPCMLLNTQTALPASVNMSALTRSGSPFYIQLY